MAPETRADAATVAKMLDIKRTVWMESTGIEIKPVAYKQKNGRPNKNPKTNSFRDALPRPFKVDGEETTQVYIADPWGGVTVVAPKRRHGSATAARRKGRAARRARKVNARERKS